MRTAQPTERRFRPKFFQLRLTTPGHNIGRHRETIPWTRHGGRIAVFTPTTSPSMLKQRPPRVATVKLRRRSGISVIHKCRGQARCRRYEYRPTQRTPAPTVSPSPAPQSPTTRGVAVAKADNGQGAWASTFNSAYRCWGRPITSAFSSKAGEKIRW